MYVTICKQMLTLASAIWTCAMANIVPLSGFPTASEIMENLENEKSIFQTWKNNGIWKNDARVMENHGKIMEFDSGKALGTLIICPAFRGVYRGVWPWEGSKHSAFEHWKKWKLKINLSETNKVVLKHLPNCQSFQGCQGSIPKVVLEVHPNKVCRHLVDIGAATYLQKKKLTSLGSKGQTSSWSHWTFIFWEISRFTQEMSCPFCNESN